MKNRFLWLAVALVLVAAAVFLSRTGQAPNRPVKETASMAEARTQDHSGDAARPEVPARPKREIPAKPKAIHGEGDVEQIWKEGTYENNIVGDLLKPFDPDELTRLAADPSQDERRFVDLILRATAEKDGRFRHLLERPEPPEDERPSIELALAAYDYSVNGNQAGLDRLLARRAEDFSQGRTGDTDATMVLAYVNEWERVRQSFKDHPMTGDGSGGDARYSFWLTRRFLYPNNPRFPTDYEEFCKEQWDPLKKAE